MTATMRPTIEELRARVKPEDVRFPVPADTKSALCRGCSAMVYFVTQPSGKPMPIDVLVDGGRVPHPAERDLSDSGSGRMFEPVDGLGVSHFATCPAAADFRGRR